MNSLALVWQLGGAIEGLEHFDMSPKPGCDSDLAMSFLRLEL